MIPRSAGAVLLALALGCGKPAGADGATSSAGAKAAPEAAASKKIRLRPEVIAAAGLKAEPVGRATLDEAIDLPGEIAANPDRMARVATPARGRIERVMFHEGAVVKANDLLAVVRAHDLASQQAAYASVAARATAAGANVKRLESLAPGGLASAQELASARAEAAGLDVEARAAEERLRALGVGAGGKVGSLLDVRSPMGGTVVERDAVVGQPIDPEHTIATVVDLSEVWFMGRVPERDVGRAREGARAEVQLNAYAGERFEGTVEHVGSRVEPVTRTVVAHIALRNRDNLLKLGLFGVARIAEPAPPSNGPAPLVLPRTAIAEVEGKTVAFVRLADGDFEPRQVKLGRSAGARVEVQSGVAEGEQVVTEGTFTLKSVVLKSTFAEEE